MSAFGIDWRGRAGNLVAGTLVSLALVVGTAVLSAAPSWQVTPEGMAMLRISFTYGGARNCRDRTPEELAALPRNMRQAQVCDRRRAAVKVQLGIDGANVFDKAVPPSGLSGTGPSRVYESFLLPAGDHHVTLGLSDDPAAAGFTHEGAFDLSLAAGQSVAIDFNPTTGDFVLR